MFAPNQEQIELRLKNELDEAQRRLRNANSDELAEARSRYRQTLRAFTRLVLEGIHPPE